MSKGSIFSEPPLREHSFTMVFNPGVNQSLVTVERYGNEPSKIWLQGDYSEWIIKPSMQDLHQRFGLSNEDWKRILGHLMFGLLPKDDLLKFRTIFPYFIRRQQDGAFLDFTKHHQSESQGIVQTVVTFLLGLDWTIPLAFHALNEREKGLKQLRMFTLS